MQFSEKTLKIGGKILMPDSNVNATDYAVIRDKTPNGIYVVWHPGTDKEQKSYVSYGWLNYKYGSLEDKDSDLNDEIPNLC